MQTSRADFLPGRFAAFLRLACVIALAAAASGCASQAAGMLLDKGLELAGIRKPEAPPVPLPPTERKVALRIHAGDQLNLDPAAHSLSVVVRIYKLKESTAFLAAPLIAFRDSDSERAAFGGELIEAREVVLAPGQKHEIVETLPFAVSRLGVVALFRAPAEGRWRFAFDTRPAEKSGITLGVHGCAMSVAAGDPIGLPPEMLRLAGVQCRRTEQ